MYKVWIFCAVLLNSIIVCNAEPGNNLNDLSLKKYDKLKSEDPYFITDLKTLHFFTENYRTIKDGKITQVNYDGTEKDSSSKRTDISYDEKMQESGTVPEIVYSKMENELLIKQKIDEVDAVTGTTYSLYRFKYACYLALMQAYLSQPQKYTPMQVE